MFLWKDLIFAVNVLLVTRIVTVRRINAATVAPGTDVSFPQDGSISGDGIARVNASS